MEKASRFPSVHHIIQPTRTPWCEKTFPKKNGDRKQIVRCSRMPWEDCTFDLLWSLPRLALNEVLRCEQGSLVLLAPVCRSMSTMCLGLTWCKFWFLYREEDVNRWQADLGGHLLKIWSYACTNVCRSLLFAVGWAIKPEGADIPRAALPWHRGVTPSTTSWRRVIPSLAEPSYWSWFANGGAYDGWWNSQMVLFSHYCHDSNGCYRSFRPWIFQQSLVALMVLRMLIVAVRFLKTRTVWIMGWFSKESYCSPVDHRIQNLKGWNKLTPGPARCGWPHSIWGGSGRRALSGIECGVTMSDFWLHLPRGLATWAGRNNNSVGQRPPQNIPTNKVYVAM